MGVGGHGVPHAALLQHCQSHGQLAGFQHLGVDELVDDPLVGGSPIPQRFFGRIGEFQQLGLIAAVGGGGDHVELGGLGAVRAGKPDLLGPHGDIEAVLIAQLIDRAVYGDGPGAADVEHTDLPALQEIPGAKVGPHVDALVDGHGLADGHTAQGDHPVHVAVSGHHLIGLIQVFNQKFIPKLLGGVALYVLGMDGITDIHTKTS